MIAFVFDFDDSCVNWQFQLGVDESYSLLVAKSDENSIIGKATVEVKSTSFTDNLGSPIILTKTLQLNHRKKNNKRYVLDSILEYGTSETHKDFDSGSDLQVVEYGNYKAESEDELENA